MSAFELVGMLVAIVAVLGFVNYRFIHLPDIIGITAAGSLLAFALAIVGRHVPSVVEWAGALASRIDFPELVFHGFLGVLLFASSLHIDFAQLARQKWPVLVLSTIGVLISTALVGCGSWWVLGALGERVELKWCLMFGALISPTDPIAVLGVLKKVSAPKALEMDIAGESLFNDGMGVVAYLTLLGIATGAMEPTWTGVAGLLALEVLGAVGVGLVVGYGAFLMLKGVDSHPVEILITIALATGGYALAERLHVSAPLATVVMGLVIGNHGARDAMSDTTRQRLFEFWDLLDELLNLMLFGLMALTLLSLMRAEESWLPVVALVPVVLVARFISVGAPAVVLRPFLQRRTPHAVKVLTWGGLRGGLSVALALSLPDFGQKDLLVLGTYAVVLFSLLVQAPTLGLLLKRLGLGR